MSELIEGGIIAITILISYGIQSSRLGFYSDDWALVLSGGAVNQDFGLSSWFYPFLVILLGKNPVIYHGLNALLLFLASLMFLRVLVRNSIKKTHALVSVVLFSVFPGFLQPAGVSHYTGFLFGITLWFAAILLLEDGLLAGKYRFIYIIAGIGFLLTAFFISPYSAILVAVSGVFLIKLSQGKQLGIKDKTAGILSFILMITGIGALFFFSKGIGQFHIGMTDLFKMLVNSYLISWRQIFGIPQSEYSVIRYIITTVFGIAILFSLLRKHQAKNIGQADELLPHKRFSQALYFLIAGVFVIFIWNILPIATDFSNNDGLIMLLLGIFACPFLVLTIDALIENKYHLVIFAILISLSIGARHSLVQKYVDEHTKLVSIFTQLSLRGDQFKDGTVIVSEQIPLDYTTAKSLNSIISNNYFSKTTEGTIHYLDADNQEIREFLSRKEMNKAEISTDYGKVMVNKNAMVGLWVDMEDCLYLLDSKTVKTRLPAELKYVADLSDPNLYVDDHLSDVKQLEQFRNTIENKWCFYYQLADSQASQKQWDRVLQTYEEAKSNGLGAGSLNGEIPRITALISTGQISKAKEISLDYLADGDEKKTICSLWSEYHKSSHFNEEVKAKIITTQSSLGCSK
jgi:hypothetical protein